MPDEQSAVQGDAAQTLWQLPDEHAHIEPEQETLWRGVPVPGSATAGPPLGLPPSAPLPMVLLEPPHAAAARAT